MQYYARYAIDILIQVCICMNMLLQMLYMYLLCTGLYIHSTCIVFNQIYPHVQALLYIHRSRCCNICTIWHTLAQPCLPSVTTHCSSTITATHCPSTLLEASISLSPLMIHCSSTSLRYVHEELNKPWSHKTQTSSLFIAVSLLQKEQVMEKCH